MTTPGPAEDQLPPKGPIAYCHTQLDAHPEQNLLNVVAIGCVMNSDGSLLTVDPSTDTADQFNVTVPLSYGDGEAELAGKVASALRDVYGVTGLADVKFVPGL